MNKRVIMTSTLGFFLLAIPFAAVAGKKGKEAKAKPAKPEKSKLIIKKKTGTFGQPIYTIENAPAHYENPYTDDEVLDVIKILRKLPREADIKYHDYTDAWAPYLEPYRKERIASLLVRVKKYSEARDELWSLYERKPLIYKGQKLWYGGATFKGVAMLFSDELWDAAGMKKRLSNAKKYFQDDDLQELYDIRVMVGKNEFDGVLDKLLKTEVHFNWHFDNLDKDFYRNKAALIVKMLLKDKQAAYPVVLARYRKELPDAIYSHKIAPLAFLLREIGSRDALADLVEGLYYPVSSNNSLARFVLHAAVETLGGEKFMEKLSKIHDKTNAHYIRPFSTGNNPMKMGKESVYESLAESTAGKLVLIPDPAKVHNEIKLINADSIDKKRKGKLIIKFKILSQKECPDKPGQWYCYEAKTMGHLWMDELFE